MTDVFGASADINETMNCKAFSSFYHSPNPNLCLGSVLSNEGKSVCSLYHLQSLSKYSIFC